MEIQFYIKIPNDLTVRQNEEETLRGTGPLLGDTGWRGYSPLEYTVKTNNTNCVERVLG